MFDLIKQLCDLTGPSAQEGPVLDVVERIWREAGAPTERSRTGNLIARVGGTGPKVLLLAHADELCYLVRAIDPRGFLWLANGQALQRTTSTRNAFTIGRRVRSCTPSMDSASASMTASPRALSTIPGPQR